MTKGNSSCTNWASDVERVSKDDVWHQWKTCFSRHCAHVIGEAHQNLPVNWNDHAWSVSLCALGALPANAATREAVSGTLREMLQVCDIGRARRAFLLVEATMAAIPLLCTRNMSAAGPKRAQMVDSFAGAVPP